MKFKKKKDYLTREDVKGECQKPPAIDTATIQAMVGWAMGNAPPQEEKPIVYRIGRDAAVYEERVSPLGSVIVKASKILTALDEPVVTGFRFALPRISFSLLQHVVSFFRAAEKKYKSEALAWIWYHPDQQQYQIEIPRQEVSGASVKADDPAYGNGRMLALEVHSHNSMGAFFSSQDNTDDLGKSCVAGVIGHVARVNPEMQFRIRAGDQYVEVPIADVFNLDEPITMVGSILSFLSREPIMFPATEVPDAWMAQLREPPPMVYANIPDHLRHQRGNSLPFAGSIPVMREGGIEWDGYGTRSYRDKSVLGMTDAEFAEYERSLKDGD